MTVQAPYCVGMSVTRCATDGTKRPPFDRVIDIEPILVPQGYQTCPQTTPTPTKAKTHTKGAKP